jgi:2-C-methyl-D-erythritol 4-phosphate cytidylyltransferase
MARARVLPSPGVPGAVWAIVVAAGVGQRFGGPKQFEPLGPGTVLERSLAVARQAADGVVVVVPAGRVPGRGEVGGGATRSDSVRCGLAAVPADAEVIVVHDGARPFASTDLYQAVIDAVRAGADGAVPGLPVTDTIKLVDDDGSVVRTPDRDHLVAVQTPQAFAAVRLRAAHAGAPQGTDDAALVEALGGRVVVVAGEADNRKLTVPEDLDWARARVAREG